MAAIDLCTTNDKKTKKAKVEILTTTSIGKEKVSKIKSDLRFIADHLPSNASYEDAMYELYVHMKVSQGKKSADEGHVLDHQEVRRKFLK